jgi:hypothetical protein
MAPGSASAISKTFLHGALNRRMFGLPAFL